MITLSIKPGETGIAVCPSQISPTLQVGQTLPTTPAGGVVIVALDGTTILLGPLQAGQQELIVPCQPDGMSLTLEVAALKQEDLPQHAPSLPPVGLGWPLWVWIVLGFLVVSLISTFIYIGKKQIQKESAKSPVIPPPSPEIRLQDHLRWAETAIFSETTESARTLYVRGYELTRAVLSARYEFQAPEATSPEFIGHFKSAMLRKGLHSQVNAAGAVVESIFSQADQVRFANENPPSESRKTFVSLLEKVSRNLL
jgi:hypothetical protein